MGDYPVWAHGTWQQVEKTLGTLAEPDVLVTDMSGINLLANPYPFMGRCRVP